MGTANAFEHGAQALDGATGAQVALVRDDADPVHAEALERVLEQQEFRFRVARRALRGGGEPGVPDLERVWAVGALQVAPLGPGPRLIVDVARRADDPPVPFDRERIAFTVCARTQRLGDVGLGLREAFRHRRESVAVARLGGGGREHRRVRRHEWPKRYRSSAQFDRAEVEHRATALTPWRRAAIASGPAARSGGSRPGRRRSRARSPARRR